jgi:hypothetical protein
MTNPRLLRDPTRRLMPVPVRLVLSLIDVDWFLTLDSPSNNAGRTRR